MNDSIEQRYFNSLDLSLEEAWKLLIEGSKDRHSPLHTPVVATTTDNGAPSQRIMVLRSADPETRILRFNTDVRVSKVSDIRNGSIVSILGYHPEAKIQLRLSGTGRIEQNGPEADNAWDEASLYGKRCYLADPAPGTLVKNPTSGLDPAIEGRKPDHTEVVPARSNFAVLLVAVTQMEWLYLAHTGHRRARYLWDHEKHFWNSRWLVP